MGRTAKGIISTCIIFVLLQGCAPSYPKDKVAGYVIELCKKEYGIDINAKLKGETLCGFLAYKEGLFDESLLPTEKAFEKISSAFFVMSRVALSSDADIKFIKLIAVDLSSPGLELTIARYTQDTRKLYASFLSKEENDLRTDVDYGFNPKLIINDQKPGEFDFEEVTLGDFLARQMARRLKYEVMRDRLLSSYFYVDSFDGQLKDRKFEVVVETKLLEEDARPYGPADTYMLELGLKIAAYVVDAYKFEDFDEVTVGDKRSRKMLKVKREQLGYYLNKKIKMGDQ